MNPVRLAPELETIEWFNTARALSLADLRGKVVVLHAFQMLCPACVSHGLPQAERLHRMFEPAGVAVVGLHSVFEHHAAMNNVALRAFIHEYRWSFPIGVDAPSPDGPVPRTMRAYGMRGTPSLVVIDAAGRQRHHVFGHVDDLAIGSWIGQLQYEASTVRSQPAQSDASRTRESTDPCTSLACERPLA